MRFILVFAAVLGLSISSEARERVRVDQALNEALKENSVAQKPIKKGLAIRRAQNARKKARAVDIEVGEAGTLAGGGAAGSNREESLKWREPGSAPAEHAPSIRALDAEAASIKIESDRPATSQNASAK